MDNLEVPWSTAFALTPTALSMIDTTGRFVVWNEAFAELLGYGLDEMDTVDVGRITRPQDQTWTRGYLMRLMSGELERFETDKFYLHRDGTEIATRL
ncbi:MAG: PAS domain S-box protein, partial [Acidimicrobiia bacterium]